MIYMTLDFSLRPSVKPSLDRVCIILKLPAPLKCICPNGAGPVGDVSDVMGGGGRNGVMPLMGIKIRTSEKRSVVRGWLETAGGRKDIRRSEEEDRTAEEGRWDSVVADGEDRERRWAEEDDDHVRQGGRLRRGVDEKSSLVSKEKRIRP
jgi:hypothetical protein